DYKHQVLATRHMAPWRVLLWTKFIEAVMQLRPRALRRVLAHPDLPIRAAQRWYYRIGRRVWPHEIWNFIFRDRRLKNGPTLAEFRGKPQDAEELAMEEERRGLRGIRREFRAAGHNARKGVAGVRELVSSTDHMS
ncbi:MAG: hypothetical protein WCN95_14055, partial [bacterium]